MRYVPYVIVGIIGFAIGVAGVTSLGVGAAYGGTFLATLAGIFGYIDHEQRTGASSR
jgi:hypothetical protein